MVRISPPRSELIARRPHPAPPVAGDKTIVPVVAESEARGCPSYTVGNPVCPSIPNWGNFENMVHATPVKGDILLTIEPLHHLRTREQPQISYDLDNLGRVPSGQNTGGIHPIRGTRVALPIANRIDVAIGRSKGQMCRIVETNGHVLRFRLQLGRSSCHRRLVGLDGACGQSVRSWVG